MNKELTMTKEELSFADELRKDFEKSIRQIRSDIVSVSKQLLGNMSSRSLKARLKKLRSDYKEHMAAYESNNTDLMDSLLYGGVLK